MVWGGDTSLIFQSGNLSISAVEKAKGFGLRYRTFVNLGNQADLETLDWLALLGDDPDTKAVCVYMEELKRGREFLQIAATVTRKKPVILLKAGRSDSGARAISSHTGALAGNKRVLASILAEVGVIAVGSLEEMLSSAMALSMCPPVQQRGTAILGDGGGHVSIACDLAESLSLNIPEFRDDTRESLKSTLNPLASKNNPVDIVNYEADIGIYHEACRICMADDSIGSVLMVGLFGGIWDPVKNRPPKPESPSYEDVARDLCSLVDRLHKPLIVHSDYAADKCTSLEILRAGGVPVFADLGKAVAALSKLQSYHLGRSEAQSIHAEELAMGEQGDSDGQEARNIVLQELAASNGERVNLAYDSLLRLLREYRIPVARSLVAATADEAVDAARTLGFPVVLKVLANGIVHKSDLGGVELDLKNSEQVSHAFDRIVTAVKGHRADALVRGVTVMPHIPNGLEVIIGMTRDDQVGPVIMFGLGGVLVEVLNDVAFHSAPISETKARVLLGKVRGSSLLNGVRGRPARDIGALSRILASISRLAVAVPELTELDLNPVLSFPDGAICVDARAVARSQQQ
jgi:acetyltransferase